MQLRVITQPNIISQEVEIIHQLFESGLQWLHIRKPNLTVLEIESLIQQIDSEHYDKLVIHDHFDLAKRYKLGGIHFTHRTKNQLTENKSSFRISCACHSIKELNAVKNDIDVALLSPVFDSISKKNYPSAFKIDELKQQLKNCSGIEIIALGGICIENIQTVNELGFSGVAVLGSIWLNPDPVQEYMKIQKEIELCGRLY